MPRKANTATGKERWLESGVLLTGLANERLTWYESLISYLRWQYEPYIDALSITELVEEAEQRGSRPSRGETVGVRPRVY